MLMFYLAAMVWLWMTIVQLNPHLCLHFVNANVLFCRQGMTLDDHQPVQPLSILHFVNANVNGSE